MTASDFAASLNARRIGRGKWQAKCPAHGDRSPSLSVAEGQDGRVLVHCFAGCALTQILAALRLTPRDLFTGTPPSPAKAQLLASERAMRNAEEQALRREGRELAQRYRKLGTIVGFLGDRLARLPDDDPDGDGMTRLYHLALDRLRAAEVALAARGASPDS
jgi:hypothetical protein